MKVTQKPRLHASWIAPEAIDVIRRLQSKGFTTYLVGGCVRDLLCSVHPKDYDIATDALPNEVRRNVYGSYVIGKRFRLVLVKRGEQQFEVATFRRASRPEDFLEEESNGPAEPREGEPSNEATSDELTPTGNPQLGDNFFGTPEEDALRRDFTINALFFDPIKEELIDYASGLIDIENRILRMIGDPVARIKEDPIRSLRALRLAHKLSFQIEPSLRSAIVLNSDLVSTTVLPRRREEYLKTLRLEEPASAFLELWDLGLLEKCLPGLSQIFSDQQKLEIFLHYLRHVPDFAGFSGNTLEIYIPFVLGYRAALQNDGWYADQEDQFLRTELGIFKGEIAEIQETFHVMSRLKDVELFKRRGYRRQQAFLGHPSLKLALKIAQFERELKPSDVLFWNERIP